MIGLAAALAVLLICLWLARGPIGVWAATDYLRRRGVASQITVERLTLDGFKGGLRLGPADDPDLVAKDIEADYALFPGRKLGLRVTAVRLADVTVKLAYDGRALRYGSLTRLIEDALAAPPTALPGPRIQFDRATVRLTAPMGAVVLAGAGVIDDARIKRLNLTLTAPRLAAAPYAAQGVTGTLTATGDDRLRAQLSLAARAVTAGAAKADTVTLILTADAPYGRDDRLSGAATAGAVLRAGGLTAAGWTGEGGSLRLDLSGALAGTLATPRYNGVTALAVEAETLRGPGVGLAGARLTLASQTLTVAYEKAGISARDPIAGSAVAGSGAVEVGGRRRTLALAYDKAGISARGPIAGAVAGSGAVDLGGRRLSLDALTVRGSGDMSIDPAGFNAALAGAAEGRGGFGAADARALADMIAPPNLDPISNAALRKALSRLRLAAPRVSVAVDKGGTRLILPQPARIAFNGGAVTVASASAATDAKATSGALKARLAAADLPRLDLTVSRYSAASGGLVASGRLAVDGALFGLRGARTAADFRLTQNAQGLRVDLTGCGPFTVESYGAPEAILKDVKGELCPSQRPLVQAQGAGWRSGVRLADVETALPTAEASLAAGAGEADIRGAGGAPLRGDIVLTAGNLTDKAAAMRFAPLKVAGRFALNGDVVTGDVGAGPSTPVATAQLTHNIATGEGRAVLAPSTITFAPDGLQPGQLSPAAVLLTKVSGAAQASATVTWTRQALDGVASVSTQGLDLTTPAGRVSGLKGAVDLTSIVPVLVTAPDQRLTVARLEAVTPLTDLDIRFSMNGDVITLGAASATLAKGKATLDPMTLSLLPNAPLSGTLRLADVDLGEVVEGFNLSDSVTIQARIEALLPFNLSPEGLRFKEGRIAATGPGRLSIKRAALTGVAASATEAAPGAPPPPPTQVNAVQDFAYQALENLAFDELDAKVDSRPEGRLGVIFHLKGRNDPPVAQKARISVMDLARGTAFDKPIPLPKGTPVDLTLDTSLNFDDLMAAYSRIGRSDAVQPGN
jgi:hypothetical protein